MTTTIVARWQDWMGEGCERLVLKEGPDGGILAESVLEGKAYSASYRIICDGSWRTRKVEVRLAAGGKRVELGSDGNGNWTDDILGAHLPHLAVTADLQRYTCLEPGRLYRYESINNDNSSFVRDIEVDEHGLVVTYPGLFKRM
ncbi:MAG: putative glycolipid-binding domain-containing protein [Nitrososphaera sp.]